jgi:circadian clock protein KaiC
MTLVQHGIFGNPVDEAAEVNHERTIRECRVGPGGLRVGEPLRDFQGVLTGVPSYTGNAAPLMHDDDVSLRSKAR